MILYIKHIAIEGPESLGSFMQEHGVVSRTIEMSSTAELPENLNGIDAVVSLGGPMNVYEEDQHPFLKQENRFIQKVLSAQVPFLGICLGSQLLSKAAGGQVGRSPSEEIGMGTVMLTDEGKCDPLFAGISSEDPLDVFQWHGDMFEIPAGSVCLASSRECPYQALRVGACAYGLQFHVEVGRNNIEEWARAYWDLHDSILKQRLDDMLKTFDLKQESFDETAQTLYSNFLKMM